MSTTATTPEPRPCHCGSPAVYGPPALCREHALAKLDRLIAACRRNPLLARSSAWRRMESERTRLIEAAAAEEVQP